MLDIDYGTQLNLDVSSFVGHSIALLGITGSGKTNTAAVLIEELLGHGLPMTIVDIEGEYWGLKQQYDLLIAGKSEHAELLIGSENAAQLAEVSVQRGISIILDLSDYTQEETYDFLVAYFKRLWEIASKNKSPYQIILEEAHEWVPQGMNTPLKQLLTRIALRGRKRGLGIILMSQRSAKVEKDVLTQASLLFLHRVVHPIDMKVYKDLIPLPGAQVEEMVGGLQPGQAVVLSQHIPQVAQIRLRHTFHAGITPTLGIITEPELRHIDSAMLQELQVLMKQSQPHTSNVEARQAKRIKELEEVLATKNTEIMRLTEQVALLSKLSVAIASPERLEISHATVGSMQVARGQSAPVVESRLVATENHRAALPVPSAKTVPLNESKLRSLIQRLQQVPSLEIRILRVLLEQQQPLRSNQLAAWLNRSESYIKNHPPYILMKLGMIARTDSKVGYVYRSTLIEYLQREFPGIEVEGLLKRLL